ncbi:MAG: universal stress protein [Firmicutes bacterium]|nr:universal stress protein [Bacillota bacterium]
MHRILLALDDRNHAEAAAWWVREWLRHDSRSEVWALYVTELISRGRLSGPLLPMSYEKEVAQGIHQHLEREVFRGFQHRVRFLHKVSPSISEAICETAALCNCDTIVLGGRTGGGFWRWLGAGIAPAVLKRTSASVVVVRLGTVKPIPLHGPHRAG